MKKVIGAATATVFGLGAFTTTATAETIVTADVLNVREKPTTESKVVEKVKNGEELKVINTEDGWSKIELNGKEVFVSSEFTKDIYHVTADLLNVRSESNTESKILGRLKKDDVIESTKQVKDGWLQFEYKGKTAYVNVSFLSSKAPIEKKADEKTKQVAKVQKSVKAKEEAKTQKITKAKETIKPKEEVKVQEVAKPKEEVKVQEVAKAKEEAKAQEVAKAKEEAKAREIAKAKEEAKAREALKAKEESKNNAQSAKRELTVVATAYTADPSENGTYGGRVLTAMGHDLTANPNMRIIAVDPKVIPLGSKVWVEGYGEAIAGDTGSAIKGNRIDVLMGSKSKAMNWGRQTVKVKIL
ncbi:Cell wall-binding protein YocH precursor [Bacillus paranthracis]|uniref:Cell wall-binding protein YocH n=1 Tax=Bacillus paranthracis TaxID=2026186 RepID=A0A7D8HFD1_9BACI|nr:3D domain-containing protein [Bacillus paranthracis]SME41242.1 Cell wall-binding protein YocH precursor [Bacillus paranthracis]